MVYKRYVTLNRNIQYICSFTLSLFIFPTPMNLFIKSFLFILFLFFLKVHSLCQQLEPGFNKEEYIEQLLISVRSVKDSTYESTFDKPARFKMIYQSPTMGLDNSWDLWGNEQGTAVISLRGTTEKPDSWLENFYAAMIPAKGEIQLGNGETFAYYLADNPRAGVHVGWVVGMAFLATDILPKIDSLYQTGIKNFIINGHSQGGAIAYLFTAHVLHLQKQGKLAKDIQFKTYCSAAPKPGNLYFAYEYEAMTQNGWAVNVVNAADWVPEVPMSIQTLDDFNKTNPFIHAETIIKKQKPMARVVLKRMYKKLDKPTRTAQKNYEKYLGKMAHKLVNNQIQGLVVPEYMGTNNYVRTGITIVLTPNDEYYQKFPDDSTKIFVHHFHEPYLFLARCLDKAFYEK